MKFEVIIRKISAFVAAFVVFFMAAGMYLSFKGFVLNEKGEIVLVKAAHAQDDAPAPAPVIPANYAMPEGMTMGKADAPIALYEFSSFGCFHCADFHLNVLPAIKEKYIDKGLVKLVFVPFPIDRASMDGALLAACVPADKYFAFVDVLFKKQREWGLSRNPTKVLTQYAALSGVSPEKAEACLHNDDTAREILGNRQNGVTQLGIQGTPSFIVHTKDKNELLSGAPTLERLEEIFAQNTVKK